MAAWRRSVPAALILGLGIAMPAGSPRSQDGSCTPVELARVFAIAPEATFVKLPTARDAALCAAMVVKSTAETLRKRVLNPKTYARAIPSFVRVDTAFRREHAGGVDLAIDWELEVPLANLSGRLWLKSFPAVVQIRLTEGAFAPGEFLWRFFPIAAGTGRNADDGVGGGRTILVLQGKARPGNASWATRKLAARHPLAEPAMTVAAALVLLRAIALDAAADQGRNVRFPGLASEAPLLARLDGELARRIADRLTPDSNPASVPPFGLLHVAPGGRLALAQIGVVAGLDKIVLDRRLAEPARWHALPGWTHVSASPTVAIPTNKDVYRQIWAITSSFPFVDFAAIWDVTRARTLRATNTARGATGALWGWDTYPLRAGGGTVAVFSLYPRLERTGVVPRKFIEKEPLLEHGLSLSLAFVDALILLDTVASGP